MPWAGPLEATDDPVIHDIPQDYRGQDGTLRMRVPGRIIAEPGLLEHITDDLALEQVANVATLPGIVGHSLAMPDIHWGYGFPIGGVAAFDPDGGIVSPGGVGFDINCGVRLLRTGLSRADVEPIKRDLLDALFKAVPAGMGSRGEGASENDVRDLTAAGAAWAQEQGYATTDDRDAMEDSGVIAGADPDLLSERSMVRGRRSLGSLGSGNHFLEVQAIDEVYDAETARAFGVDQDEVVVMIHTGSRGLGHQVCQEAVQDLQGVPARHGIELPDRQLACAPLDSEEARQYMGAMAAAANFAFVNRSILTARTREVFGRLAPDADVGLVYDVCHNIAKYEEHQVDGRTRRVCVHRKGATRAFPPGHPELAPRFQATGQPVVVPGDMGRVSFLLAGAEGAMEKTFGSCCHGAGRRLSRTAAKKQYSGKDLIDELGRAGIIVRATSAQVAAEEAPGAYKDVSQVVDSVVRAGLAGRVARMRPLGVVKG